MSFIERDHFTRNDLLELISQAVIIVQRGQIADVSTNFDLQSAQMKEFVSGVRSMTAMMPFSNVGILRINGVDISLQNKEA